MMSDGMQGKLQRDRDHNCSQAVALLTTVSPGLHLTNHHYHLTATYLRDLLTAQDHNTSVNCDMIDIKKIYLITSYLHTNTLARNSPDLAYMAKIIFLFL